MKRSLAIGLVTSLCACAAQSDGGVDVFCDLEIEVLTADPLVGEAVFVRATADNGQFISPNWSIRFNDGELPFVPESTDDREISFIPEDPGPYTVVVSDADCAGATETINVIIEGANMTDFRLRMTPPAGSGEAPSELTARVFGGGDYVLGVVNLDQAFAVSGIVTDGATPIESTIRVETAAGQLVLETFSDALGAYSMSLPDETVVITILPADSTIAPMRLTTSTPSTVSDFDVGGADAITGVVRSNGTPLAGAAVVLNIDGVASSVGVTAGDGSYALSARAGSVSRLKVVPPDTSGLPTAELLLTDDPVDGSVIDLDFAALAVTSQTFTVTEADGSTAAPGARVLLAADNLPAVASVTVGGAAQNMAIGRVRRFAVANGAGQVANLMLADADYTVVAEPAAGGAGRPAMTSSDTTGGATVVAQLGDTAIDWIADVRSSGAAVAGAVVTARPVGLVSALSAGSATAQSDAGGSISLPLIGGATYELQIDPPPGHSREHVGQITAPAVGMTDAGTISLVGSITVSGTVRSPGGSAERGVHMAFYCIGCATPDVPIAEGISGSNGRFSVELPDPGIGQ